MSAPCFPWLLACASVFLTLLVSALSSCEEEACPTTDAQDLHVLLQQGLTKHQHEPQKTQKAVQEQQKKQPMNEPQKTQKAVNEQQKNLIHRKRMKHLHKPRHSSEAFPENSLLSMASSALESIVQGSMTKSEVEIVLAQYNEDVEWSDVYSSVRTIYCKGDSKTQRPAGCVPLPNVGREGHTYLHHIVKNYDTLSKWTVFSQAQSPTQGYKGHRRGGGHMLPGVPFDAYVLPEEAGGLPRDDGSAFVFTGALHKPTLNHSLRLGFIYAKANPVLHEQSKCPTTSMLDGWQKWWDLGWFKSYIGRKCGVDAKEVPAFAAKYWNEFIQLPQPQDDIIFFSQGARFAASRERIHQRPREYYARLLDLLSKEEDPCHNYLNEWMWYYIIGKPTDPPCSSRLVTEEASRSHTMTQAELLETYRAMLLEENVIDEDMYDNRFVADDDSHEDQYADKFVVEHDA